MNRFFILPENIKDKKIVITGSDVNHIKNVLRFKKGNKIIVFDGTGKEYSVVIEYINNEVEGKIVYEQEIKDELQISIVLLQAIPKGSKMDFVVQKCTEVGVNKIIPLITERTIVKLDAKKITEKKKRWQNIAKSSAQQSGRVKVTQIDEPVTFGEVLSKIDKKALNIIPWETETGNNLSKILKNNKSLITKNEALINIFIGPEGGFTYQELEKAKREGVIPVSLGPRILRTETAGLAVAVMVLYEVGALG